MQFLLTHLSAFIIIIALANPVKGYAQSWPREIINSDGSMTTLDKHPQRILSTSVTVTGTLLAINAPVVASAATVTGEFFSQWRAVAKQRGLNRLWPAGSIDIEAAYTTQPDVIIVSENGADSALAHIELLRTIAPVIVVNYSNKDWQTLAKKIGSAIGYEQEATSLINQFNQDVKYVKQRITIPPGTANIISYNGAGLPNPIVTSTGTHGRLIESLGFTVEQPDQAWHSSINNSKDFVRAEYEHLTLLQSDTTFLIRATDHDALAFKNDPVLVNLNSVRSGQVYGLGANSFRVDFYSASEILNIVDRLFTNES